MPSIMDERMYWNFLHRETVPRSAFDFNESSTSEDFDCFLAAQASRPMGARWASNEEISWPNYILEGYLIDVAVLAEV